MTAGAKSTHNDEHFNDPEEVRKYAAHMEKFAGMYRDFVQQLQSVSDGSHFLEIGAGTGLLTRQVAAAFPTAHITALEISPHMAEYGEEYLDGQGYGSRVSYVVGNAEEFGAVEQLGRFDLVYSSLVLHEFSQPDETLRILYDRVEPDGSLALLDLRRVWWLSWVPSSEGFFRSIRAAYRPCELRELFGRIGMPHAAVRSVFPFLLSATVRRPQ